MEKDFRNMIILPFVGIVVFVLVLSFYSSCYSAKIYNKQNGTDFTCVDFFWASEQINSQTQTIKLK